MVRLNVKKGDNNQFLYDTYVDTPVNDVILDITIIYNGRLKISRICADIENLIEHGTMLPPNMVGLTDEQVEELKLHDDWGDRCVPSGGWTFNKDVIGCRNGHQPNEKMREVLKKTVEEAKAMVSKKQVDAGVPVTKKMIGEAIDILRGAVTIVYPMGLPPHDPIRREFDNTEDLSGTQASLDVIELSESSLWFSGRELVRGKKLSDYVGRNDKTRAVVKIQKIGQGAPGREPLMSESQQKELMLHAYRRQEELKVTSKPSELTGSGSDACRVEIDLQSSTPRMPADEDKETSVEAASRALFGSNPVSSSTLPTINPLVGEAPLTDINRFLNPADYSIFNICKK